MREDSLSAPITIGVIGLGPSGLGVLERANEKRVSHIGFDQADPAQSIREFARGKPLTAAPADQFLRSGLPFCNGMTTRERVLDEWYEHVAKGGLNIKLHTVVSNVLARPTHFEIHYGQSEFECCKHVVIAIGGQGAPRKLNVPGANLPIVRYSLDDPAAFKGQCVAVVGGGNAAVENALQLQQCGAEVYILTRGSGFDKANPAVSAQIREAIARRLIWHFPDAKLERVNPGGIEFTSTEGHGHLPCECVLARLGFHEPREFLKACGLPEHPTLSEVGEVQEMPGFFIVGPLAGRPLIWQAIEQGYEVVETILGNPVQPAHINRLVSKLAAAGLSADIPQLAEAFREHDIEMARLYDIFSRCQIRRVQPGEAVVRHGDYPAGLHIVASGHLETRVGRPASVPGTIFGAEEFFARPKRRYEADLRAAEVSVVLTLEEGQFMRMPDTLKIPLVGAIRHRHTSPL